jgi:hypothetical protein
MLAWCKGPFIWFSLVGLVAAPAAQAQQTLDLALVIAVDVSWSMTAAEQELQQAGFVEAFRSPKIHKAIQQGALGRIAVTYVEWAEGHDQAILVPWTIVDGAPAALAVAERLARHPTRQGGMTSISGVIDRSMSLFADLGAVSMRRVIDISGDGPNNDGPKVTYARDRALSEGVTINGLPIMIKNQPRAWDMTDLDFYYRDCVIGGAGSFVAVIHHADQFMDVIRTKLLREITGYEGRPSLIAPAQSGADCLSGEKRRREEEALGGEGNP